ncbi:MAG TPA: T9SS type A sorting domain-containing protein, partial [Bacteroidia bacterium]|nr:T9SS type A sorting domain-containing protein [Bacteroidia bacterium]
LVGWYKSSFASAGDELAAYVTMYSGTTNVAYGTVYLTVSQSTYTRFAIHSTILMTTSIDSVQLNFIISSSSSAPNINSYAIVDDLHFVSGPSGINEQQHASALSVFPNPANSLINFSVPEKSTLELYGIDGKLLLSKTVDQGNAQLDIADLPEGMMMLVLRNEKQLFRQEIVHQR